MASRRQRLTFPGTTAGLAEAAFRLRSFLDEIPLAGDRRYQIELAFDEIVSNIIRYGHPSTDVEVIVSLEGPEAILTFDDDGRSFDPRTHTPRPLDTDPEHAEVGGFGLGLVRTFATRFDYEQTPRRHNRLTVTIPLT